MAGHVEYTTKIGDRWDLIAYKSYGDATMMQPIIDANPGLAIDAVFEPGVILLIPILEDDTAGFDLDLLPPWSPLRNPEV